MFDPDLLESNSLAREALAMLLESGILRAQQIALEGRLRMGDPSQPVSELIPQIKAFRMNYGILESLIQTATEYREQKGQNNA
jgi:hypothetical protein